MAAGKPDNRTDFFPGLDWDPPGEVAPVDAREADPLGGRPRASGSTGGLESLWRRFRQNVQDQIRRRELEERFRRRQSDDSDKETNNNPEGE